ncbi:hypothetical protein BOTCAL_0030g00280 [Botryotinia calthae]|uniref:Uncharacterized protein n=1 Tax=Botryotinia calthae TaxID=38488 RepID=A0A4Y8DDF7_9HELO|nr:hypothetical protein BOTCAL_0030g00280 [Botryotinia calthae]
MSALPENNSQVYADPEDNDFPDDFDAEYNEAYDQQAAVTAAPVFVTEKQEEAGIAEDNGFPDDFEAEYNEAYDQQATAAVPAPAPAPIPARATEQQVETMVVDNESQVDEDAENNGFSDEFQTLLARVAADERKAVQEHPSARLAELMGMRVNEHGIIRSKCTIEERKAKQQVKQARREAREQAAREKRISGYRSLGISKLQAICLN